jgi:hypothetical protein
VIFIQTVALVALVAAPSPTPSPGPTSPAPISPAPAGSAAPSTSPSAGATVIPSAAPTAFSSASPQASPGGATPAASDTPVPYTYRFVPRQPDNPAPGTPAIYAVYLNDKKLHSQGPIDIKVTTSPEVVKVVSRSGGQEGVIPMVAPGDFEANSKLPKVPFIASGMTVYLDFVATGPTGIKTTVRVPVQLK